MHRTVGIMAHRSRVEALDRAVEVIAWLEARGIGAALDAETALKIHRPNLAFGPEGLAGLEFILTLGGDGTILTAARMAAPSHVPILGVHMGRFGFITETAPEGMYDVLELALNGEARIEERLMIRGDIWRGGRMIFSGVGLNEVLVKSGMSHMLLLRTYLGGSLFANYPADGIIVATPTGSTAYALSAGGPLVEPTVQAFVMVPICPHTLSARPLVIPCDQTIEIEIECDGGEVICAMDGVDPISLRNGDRVVASRAKDLTRLIVMDEASFYHKIRDRYLYGERVNG